MTELTLKAKKKIIVDYLNDVPLEKIAMDLKISLDDIKNVLDEWKNGYISIFMGDSEISEELRELARLMKSKELTVEDLITGYILSQVFKNSNRDKIIKISKEIESMDENKRKEFLETSEKMLKFSKYKNINYVDIPDALESMVNKGKELNKDIKEKENLIKNMEQEIKNLEEKIQEYKQKERELNDKIQFAENLRDYLKKFNIDEKKLNDFLKFISETNYAINRWEEIYKTTELLKQKNLEVENFLKLSNYLISLLDFGLDTGLLKNLKQELENESIDFKEFIEEVNDYVKDKISYKKEIEELKKEHKSLENQIRAMRSEIKEYFKKIKPKMQ
ncbi:MAG: hypothetical protein RAK23_01310 [Thermoplasmata archaeon]|nr:hypothetical protein [Thermoplasmata archaeon]